MALENARTTAAWVAAGVTLGNNPRAQVSCPACGKACLVVRDIPDKNSANFERFMGCPICGSHNILLMTASH